MHKGQVVAAEPCLGTELLAGVGGGERPPLSQRCLFLCKGALIWPVTSELATHQLSTLGLFRGGPAAEPTGQDSVSFSEAAIRGWLTVGGPRPRATEAPKPQETWTEGRGCGCCEGGMLRGPALLLGAPGAPGPQTKPLPHREAQQPSRAAPGPALATCSVGLDKPGRAAERDPAGSSPTGGVVPSAAEARVR